MAVEPPPHGSHPASQCPSKCSDNCNEQDIPTHMQMCPCSVSRTVTSCGFFLRRGPPQLQHRFEITQEGLAPIIITAHEKCPQSADWRPLRFIFGLTYQYTHPPLHIQARNVFQTFLCVASGAGRDPEAAARRRGGDTRTPAGKHSTATHTHTHTRRREEA